MGGQQALVENAVVARQVIFTSLRTRMGEGYRVVAASVGVSPDERMEITRCSPSHGGLCGDGPEANGLASYRLGSGAHCVALSRHAGVEQSGRGGLRVYTHALLLEETDFAAFGADPFAVRDAAIDLIGEPLLKPPPALESLHLPRPKAGAIDFDEIRHVERVANAELDRCAALLVCLLRGKSISAENVTDSAVVLRRVFAALPTAARKRLSVACGLRFSPYRQFDVVLLDHALPSRESRRVAERAVALRDWNSMTRESGTPYDDWALFAQRLWHAGQVDTLSRLTRRLKPDAAPSTLSRVASLFAMLQQAQRLPLEDAERLIAGAMRTRTDEPVEAQLCERLRLIIAARKAEQSESASAAM